MSKEEAFFLYLNKMIKIIFICFLELSFFTMLSAQNRRMAISARVAETSMMYVVLPMTIGLTLGPNFEYRISNSGFLGTSHCIGYSTFGVTNYRLHDTEVYYYYNNFLFNFINQAGLRFTVCEAIARKDYMIYGDRIHAWGLFLGNNRIGFSPDFPRIIFGVQFSVTVSQKLERQVKSTLPTSFLFLSVRYMLNAKRGISSKYHNHE
jgi:hypothetical protein